MRFGYFDDESREYVITRPDTPLPWINYLGCQDFIGIISNTAGGYSFYRDARLRRLTRYRYNNVPTDCGGRYIYLRDNDSGDFWSPCWQPTRHEVEDYTCRHGLGYSIIGSTHQGIQARTCFTVPLRDNAEVWRLTLTNHRQHTVSLGVFSCIEFALWDAWDDATNFQRNLNIGEVEIEDGVIYHKTEYRERRDHYAFFACSEELAGFDTQRETFLGAYRGWDRPAAVERGRSFNSWAHGWAPIGSHHVEVTLEPDSEQDLVFILGYQENPKDRKFDPPGSQSLNKSGAKAIVDRYSDVTRVATEIETLRSHWDDLLGGMQVETPNEHVNRMVNIWNAYQNMATFNLSRSASYFESGVGRGMGFRDSNQDLLGFVHMVPDRARERILDLAATQLESGGAFHQYQPLTKRGNEAVGGDFNDDPHWLVLSTAAYLKETGDWSILHEPVPYENRPGTERPLVEHLQRCIRFTLDRLGPHGLPLMGRADWNDCLNLNTFSETPGKSFQTAATEVGEVAESVFIGGLFVLSAQEMAAIAEHQGLPDEAQYYLSEAAQMKSNVLAHGWDGEWFLRAYDAFGERIGSHTCEEGQIYIEPQGINVITGIGIRDGKAEQALASVQRRLATPHGIVLHQPAYTHYYLNLGEISSYPPGYKENAGIFCHTNPWIMIAETVLGRGDRALDYYLRINPSARERISDTHRTEPYVYAQMIAGRDAATHGEAKNSWLTGTAAWNYVAITQWILGIRPTYQGLRITPVIPEEWEGFTARRKYRGATYELDVRRRGSGNRVVLIVDGQEVQGDILPLPEAEQSTITVEVWLGSEDGVD